MDQTTTALVARLKLYLALPDGDYWFGYASSKARAMIERDEKTLLGAIREEIAGWPDLMQEHLAHILGDTGSVLEIDILERLIHHPHGGVATRARDALRDARQFRLRRTRP